MLVVPVILKPPLLKSKPAVAFTVMVVVKVAAWAAAQRNNADAIVDSLWVINFGESSLFELLRGKYG
jgi:hypothetical protein